MPFSRLGHFPPRSTFPVLKAFKERKDVVAWRLAEELNIPNQYVYTMCKALTRMGYLQWEQRENSSPLNVKYYNLTPKGHDLLTFMERWGIE
jgi:DNA-binding IclR family transcriptional regulator